MVLMTSQENSSSDIISHLTPGAQYRVVVYHTNGPLSSPPSEPVIIDIGQPISSGGFEAILLSSAVSECVCVCQSPLACVSWRCTL